MILCVGTDIMKIQRMRDILSSDSSAFLNKVFTKRERQEASNRDDPALYYATRFAGKEAVFKCLGSVTEAMKFSEIEVLNAPSGQPQVCLLGSLHDLAEQRGIKNIHLSLSYEDDFTVAFAVAEGTVQEK